MLRPLEFTGNWFIDAGILGFVNLMEEVYGDVWKEEWKEKNPNEAEWKFNFLEYLNEKIRENKELVYYGYFPFAYFVNNLRVKLSKEFIESFISQIQKEKNNKNIFEQTWSFIDKFSKRPWINKKLLDLDKLSKIEEVVDDIKNIKNLFKKLSGKKDDFKKLYPKKKKFEITNISQFNNLMEEIRKNNHNLSKEFCLLVEKIKKIKEKIQKKLATLWDKKDINSSFFRIPIADRFFINFLIFQTGKDYTYSKQKKDLLNIIEFNLAERKILRKFDRTLNKFLISEGKMINVFYTSPINMKTLKKHFPNFCVLILCFPLAFFKVNNKFYFFYSPELKFSYFVNKKLKIYINRFAKKNNDNILRITYHAIIDTLIEHKSGWSLENMYIISHEGIDKNTQEIKNVEYIGIPKLQAQVLLDDHIRNALNQRVIIYKAGKNTIKKWILEEFISGKPLYPLAFQHIKTCLANDINVNYFIFHSLLLDAAILEFKEKQKESKRATLFSSEFLKSNYREIVQKVKREFSRAYYYTTQDIPRYFEDYDERKRFAYLLLNALHSKNKAEFLYILLKKLNTEKIINEPPLNWIFNKIINKDINWREYSLLLTAGLVYKNE